LTDEYSSSPVVGSVQTGIAFADRSHPDKRLVSGFSPRQYRHAVGWPWRFIDSKNQHRIASALLP